MFDPVCTKSSSVFSLRWALAIFNQLSLDSDVKKYLKPHFFEHGYMLENENNILSSSFTGIVMFITYSPGNVLRQCIAG